MKTLFISEINPSVMFERAKRVFALLALFFAAIVSAHAAPASNEALKKINFDQKIGAAIPVDLKFNDEGGRSVKLGEFFGKKPVVLVLGYYRCPMLCNFVLNGMVNSLDDIKWEIGKEFDVVDVSIDPQEKPELAAAKKKTYVRRYGRNDSSGGWHFLTGDAAEIAKLADAVGFKFLYDDQIKEYAHPSGLIIVTKDGRVSQYISGLVFSTEELDRALQSAAKDDLGSPVRQFFLMCFHYSPITGKYGNTVMLVVRLTGIAVLLGLVIMFIRNYRKAHRTKTTPVLT